MNEPPTLLSHRGRNGGKARAAALEPTRRREIASQAASARWRKKAEADEAAEPAEGGDLVPNTPHTLRGIHAKFYRCRVVGPAGHVLVDGTVAHRAMKRFLLGFLRGAPTIQLVGLDFEALVEKVPGMVVLTDPIKGDPEAVGMADLVTTFAAGFEDVGALSAGATALQRHIARSLNGQEGCRAIAELCASDAGKAAFDVMWRLIGEAAEPALYIAGQVMVDAMRGAGLPHTDEPHTEEPSPT